MRIFYLLQVRDCTSPFVSTLRSIFSTASSTGSSWPKDMTGLRDGQSRSGEGWDWCDHLEQTEGGKMKSQTWRESRGRGFNLVFSRAGGFVLQEFASGADPPGGSLVPGDGWQCPKKHLPLRLSRERAAEGCEGNGSFFFFNHTFQQLFPAVMVFIVHCTEHPEILDDRSKGEEANSFWKRLVRVIRWGRYCWWCSRAWTQQEHKLICNATSPPAVLHRKSHNKPTRTTVECLSWRYRHASQAYCTRLESFWCLFAHSVHSFTVLEVPCAGKTSAVFTEGHTKDSQEDLQGALWLQAPWTGLNSIFEVALLLCDLHLHCGCMRLTPGGGGLLTKSQSLHDNYI